MAKIIFQDEQGQNLNWYKLTPVEGQTDVYALERMANITQQGTPYNKEVGEHFLQVEDGTPIQTLTCTKAGTAYALTGTLPASGFMPCKFIAPDRYNAGDTFTVNGVAYTISTINGLSLSSGAFTQYSAVNVTLAIDTKYIIFQNMVHTAAEIGALPLVDHTNTQMDANTLFLPGIHKCNNWLNLPPWATSAQGIIEVRQYASYNDGTQQDYASQTYYDVFGNAIGYRVHAGTGWISDWIHLTDYASGNVALTTPALRNIEIVQAEPTAFIGTGNIAFVAP